MRTLLVLGILAVLLLVTPSNSAGTQDGGGEKEISSLREFIGQNEDGRADWMEEESSLSNDGQVLLRSRRQNSKPKKKICNGCFTSLSVKDKPIRSRRHRKESRRRGKKKNAGKRRLEELEGGMRRDHHHRHDDHHQHPEGVMEEKTKRRSGTRSIITSSRYGGVREDLGDGKEMEGRRRKGHHHRHPPSSEDEKDASPLSGGIMEDLGDGKWWGTEGAVQRCKYGTANI
ncbi:uncharacterized protein ACMZJ9_008780 [Mantella aurantiaca]